MNPRRQGWSMREARLVADRGSGNTAWAESQFVARCLERTQSVADRGCSFRPQFVND